MNPRISFGISILLELKHIKIYLL